jgi:fluoroacetyl-CoA thioesterase
MKQGLRPGLSRVRRVVVDGGRTIGFMGEEGRVYSTPDLARDIEHACRDLLLEFVDPGEDSVGIEITVRHTAPTLPGMAVEITTTVTAVDGRKVTFEATAKDDVESIGGGAHTRFMIDVAKTFERLKAKAAKRAATSVG